MADKSALQISSKEEVAVEMATRIFVSIEKKVWSQITREEYLRTVVQCVDALSGIAPSR